MKMLRAINSDSHDPICHIELIVNVFFGEGEPELGVHRFRNKASNSNLVTSLSAKSNLPHVFVITSFSPDMEPIFEGIRAAGAKNNLKVARVIDIDEDYKITDKIAEMIDNATLIVADLTHGKQNVYYELAVARTLGKKIITIAREGTKLHFLVRDWNCKFYNDSRVIEEYLTKRFAQEKCSLDNWIR